MRLTCPNCGAEYEVPDEVIPASGRDVQCSNCGDTWFQHHPDYLADLEEDSEASDLAPQDPDPVDDIDDSSAEDHAPYDDLGEDDDYDEDEEDPRPPLRRRALDPAVQSILREEAEYEEKARGREPLESQPDLGLTEPAPTRREDLAEERLSRLRDQTRDEPHAEPHDIAPAAAAAAASRRDLLPDIEEINSSLRRKGDTMRGGAGSTRDVARREKSGTRRGFIAVLVILALGASLYLQAPNIGAKVPQLQGPMTTYVAAVDRGRAWLDRQAATLAAKLDEMAADPSGASAPTE